MLSLDEATHTYRWRGKVVPGVTSILERAHSFGMVDPDALAAAQNRGTYVHRMCELFDLDDLDDSEADGEYGGYLTAWKSFLNDYAPNWEGIEAQGYSESFGYAGTMDRCGVLERRFGSTPWVIDIKTSAASHKIWGVQTAAYRQLLAERQARWALARRATVQLRADGKYRFLTWDSPFDWPAFQALITLNHWNQHA